MADASWWIPLLSGAMGAGGALGGTWLTQRSTRRRDAEQWERQRADKLDDARSQLYLDLMEYVRVKQDWVLHMANLGGVRPPSSPPDPDSESRLGARVSLLGDLSVRELWREAMSATLLIEEDARIAAEAEGDDDALVISFEESDVNAAQMALDHLEHRLRRLMNGDRAGRY
jgi:hypothetical protein